MAISTVNVDFSAILQNAAQATGLLRVRLSQVGTVEDSETGDTVILPITWQETTLTDGAATLALVPNKLIEPSCTYYEIQLKSVPDCPKACAKLLLSGIMYVPDEDCNVLDLLISPPSPETANTASGYASQAKQAAQVAENFAIQAGDRYDDVAEAAATALTDIGTAKTDALDAIGTAQSGATEAISTAEDAALQAIGQARGAALDDIGTAQGTATAAVQAEGNTQVGRVEDAGEDAVADVTAAQATAVSAVQAQQATSIAAVTAEGTRQIGLVTAEGTAQVNAVTQTGNGYVATMQGLVSDAQAARDAAQTAQGLAEDAQAAAESASTEAQGYAGDASTSAGQAAQSASDAATSANDAATSATVAQASAESIEASAEQIQTNGRNITNIQALLNGTLYREETDSAEAYSKTVPAGALPYASVDMIGGKTVVWNQLVQNGTFADTSGWSAFGGTISASNNELAYTLTTVNNNSFSNIILRNCTLIAPGHKFFVSMDVKLAHDCDILRFWVVAPTVQDNVSYELGAVSGGQWVTLTKVYTSTNTAQSEQIQFLSRNAYTNGYAVGDVDYIRNIVLIDLTQMFGPGNEPSTVAEFEAMFPTIDPAYNAGELMSAGVTQAVSEGRNILDVPDGSYTLATNYFGAADGLVTVSGATQAAANADAVYIKTWERFANYGTSTVISEGNSDLLYPGTYTFSIQNVSGNFANGAIYVWGVVGGVGDTYQTGVKYFYKTVSSNNLTETFTITSPQRIAISIQKEAATALTSVSFNLQLERGSTATAYTPYRSPVSYPIPSAIQSLPGYGWSTLNKYNSVDFVTKKFTENCRRVRAEGDLITLYWNGNKAMQLDTNKSITFIVYVAGEGYPATTGESSNFLNNKGLIVQAIGLGQGDKIGYNFIVGNIYVCLSLATLGMSSITSADSDETILAALKTALATYGLEFVYNLATPIETDISEYLTDDNLINVEPGGTVSFPSQLDDDYRLPVPNEETFLVQATPELPTTDGTYTLQCTVTDGTPSVTWVTA